MKINFKPNPSTLYPLPSTLIITLSIILFFSFNNAYAENKQWSGKIDALSWDKEGNWFPTGAPTSLDDATVDALGANVLISKNFSAASLNIGGRTDSTVTAANYISGSLTPVVVTDNALYIRKGGNLILQGSGAVTLQGAFKNTEETLADEPAFMFEAQ